MLRITRLIEADPAMELEVIASAMHPTFGATVEAVRFHIPISKVAIDAAARTASPAVVSLHGQEILLLRSNEIRHGLHLG
jgi:hypothetical protein